MRVVWLLTCVLAFCSSTFAMFESDALRTLGLRKGATPEEIKKAYKTKALQYHPDKVRTYVARIIDYGCLLNGCKTFICCSYFTDITHTFSVVIGGFED